MCLQHRWHFIWSSVFWTSNIRKLQIKSLFFYTFLHTSHDSSNIGYNRSMNFCLLIARAVELNKNYSMKWRKEWNRAERGQVIDLLELKMQLKALTR